LPHRIKQNLATLELFDWSGGNDEELCYSSGIGTTENGGS
jgi:hypothetical protein